MRTSVSSGILREVAVNDVNHLGNLGTCLIFGSKASSCVIAAGYTERSTALFVAG